MTTRICLTPGCDQPIPTGDNTTACPQCWNQLLDHLAQTPALVDELNTTITRQTAITTRNGPRSTETPLPYHPAAAEALARIDQQLAYWIHETTRHMGGLRPQPGQPAMAALILIRLLPTMRRHTAGHDAIASIVQAVRDGWRIVDRPTDLVYAGPCAASIYGQTCPAELWAKPGEQFTRCRTCGSTWDTAERSRWIIEELRDTLVTALEASRIIAIHGEGNLGQQQISRWRQRGQIAVRGHDPVTGAVTYRLGDLLDLSQTVRPGRPKLDKPESA